MLVIFILHPHKGEIAGYGNSGTNVFVTVSDSDSNTQNVVSSTVLVSPVGTWSMVVNISTLLQYGQCCRDGLNERSPTFLNKRT